MGLKTLNMQVVLYYFDCLYLDGEVLLKKSLRERREAMHKAIIPQEGKVQFATCKTSKDVEELQVRHGTSGSLFGGWNVGWPSFG